MDMMISNAAVITMAEEYPFLQEGFVGIRDGSFTFVSLVQPRIMARSFIDGAEKTLAPLAAFPALQALAQADSPAGSIMPEQPADLAMLEGVFTPETLAEARVQDIRMVLAGGRVLWQKPEQE